MYTKYYIYHQSFPFLLQLYKLNFRQHNLQLYFPLYYSDLKGELLFENVVFLCYLNLHYIFLKKLQLKKVTLNIWSK